jgi:hypothetical protein
MDVPVFAYLLRDPKGGCRRLMLSEFSCNAVMVCMFRLIIDIGTAAG